MKSQIINHKYTSFEMMIWKDYGKARGKNISTETTIAHNTQSMT